MPDTPLSTAYPDLTHIAGLSPSNDDVLQRKTGAWANRTLAQLMTDLSALGTTFQPLDSDLTAIAALTTTSFGRAFLALADAAATRTAIGLALGTDIYSKSAVDSGFQPLDSDLTAIAALTTTSFGRAFLALADAAATRTAIGLALGTDIYSKAAIDSGFQPLDSDLTSIAALATTSFGRNLLLATAATAAGLGLTNGAAMDSWAAITRASGFDTLATTPSSANLRALLTDELGTGAALFDGATPTAIVLTNASGTADSLVAGSVTRNHAVYASASPPTVDVGIFAVATTSVNLKAAGTTAGFTVPSGRTFVCTGASAIVTSVTSGGAGTQTFQIKESGANGAMTPGAASGSGTPVAGTYYASPMTSAQGPYTACAAGNIVNIVVSTSHAGSTAVTGTVFITGFYSS